MKLSLASVLFLTLIFTGRSVVAQDSAATANPEPPILEESQATPPNSLELRLPATTPQPPLPALQDELPMNPVVDYRLAIKALSMRKHQFVHVKLKNGKVLTGTLSNVNEQGFGLNTDAIGDAYVLYRELAEKPRPVHAVGTRIKQGAEWTGLIALVIVAIPIFIPLLLTGVVPDC